MIAIAKVGGHQILVEKGDLVSVDLMHVDEGATVELETLLVSDVEGKETQIGASVLENVKVEAKVVEHTRTGKVRVFKMNPRKRYRRNHNHRQKYTIIEITDIKVS